MVKSLIQYSVLMRSLMKNSNKTHTHTHTMNFMKCEEHVSIIENYVYSKPHTDGWFDNNRDRCCCSTFFFSFLFYSVANHFHKILISISSSECSVNSGEWCMKKKYINGNNITRHFRRRNMKKKRIENRWGEEKKVEGKKTKTKTK